MASVYNQATGEWEEKEDTGPNAFSTQGATAMGPGLSGLYSNQPAQSASSFTSPIDNQSHSTEWSGPTTVDTKVENWGSGESAGSNINFNGYTGALTNKPGDALTYQYGPGQNPYNPETGTVTMADPAYQKWMSGLWAAKHPQEYSASQAESNGGGGIFDMGMSLFNSDTMLPIKIAAAAYAGGLNPGSLEGIFGSGGGEALAGESFGGIDSFLGDSSYWGAIDSINPNLALETGSAALAAPSSVANMSLGLQNLGQLSNGPTWNSSPWNPESTSLGDATTTSLENTIEPKQFIDDAGRGTNAAGDMVNGSGQRAWQDVSAESLRDMGMARDTAGSLTQGASNMWDKLTTPMGGKQAGMFQKPTPLSMGVRALGSLDSWSQGKRAQEMLEEQMNRSRGMGDQNAARGTFANNEWMKTQSDPMYGYGSFMQGAGRDFVNNARAAASKSGNRGGYLNTGRMNSDLASLWQKNQTQRAQSLTGGFANDPYASSNSITPSYANLIKNQNAPLFQGLEGGMKAFQLADLFGGD